MATKVNGNESTVSTKSRDWLLFAIHGYAKIVARKHSLPAPMDDLESLSTEELESFLTLLRDLAHLPPG